MDFQRLIPKGLFVSLLLSSAAPASAQVFQTDDDTPLPQPVPMNELVDNSMSRYGYKRSTLVNQDVNGNNLNPGVLYGDLFPTFEDGDPLKLSGLFKWRNENIDPVKDARIEPGYFSPSCGFSGELVMRGGSCNLAFGWYNVLDPNDPTPPAADEIYELIPANTETYMHCVDQNGTVVKEGTGFCPQGWDPHIPYRMSVMGWTPKAFDSGMIASDPRYKGKYVAFALIGNSKTQCTQTKHSIAAHNVKSAQSGKPWITTLIWQSTVDPEAFYMAFEDLAMDPSSWKKVPAGQIGANDGDFNDFVFYISGISCQGGGQACDTGLQGACSLGRTDCAIGAEAPACRPIIQPGDETCDNVDNNCNGVVDDGDGLCPADQVCDKGVCVASCTTGEFRCPSSLECNDDGFCIDKACLNVECPAGQACRQGQCVNACDNVVCPAGQECQLGRCVDPCRDITCPAGRVCEKGLCISNCGCRGCDAGLECASDGHCVDPSCSNMSCPSGFICQAGACVDPCEGVVCPGGAICTNGTCPDPVMNGMGGSATEPPPIIVASGGSTSAGPGGTPSTGAGATAAAPQRPAAKDSGCGCRTGSAPRHTGTWLVSLAGSLLIAARRRRRSAR